jgi:nucleoside-diphosphate-sugar epimerase/ribosomal protein S18 acetylase RimI-like enzyme
LRLFIFGPGYVGLAFARRMKAAGWSVAASARGEATSAALSAGGVDPVPLVDVPDAAAGADAILVTAAPDDHGCPALPFVAAGLAGNGAGRWIGYLSSTGVYGDRGGRWVFEHSALRAQSVAGARRVAAEHDWRGLGLHTGAAVAVFRLPGIYGPARSAFDRLRDGSARRVVRPGQVFSRIHVDDLCAALQAALARPRAGAAYNLCDDEPGPPQDVIAEAARLLGLEPPPETPFDAATIPAASQRFFAESKRVSNALAKAELGWRPTHPTYREGLRAILAAEASPRIELRPATATDAADIQRLTRAAYAKWVPVTGREPAPMTADYDHAVRTHRFDLLYVDGVLTGLIETVDEGDQLLIENVAIHPSAHGQGHGRRLLALAETIARTLGHTRIRLFTNNRWAANVRLYLGLGYRIDSEDPIDAGMFRVNMSKALG